MTTYNGIEIPCFSSLEEVHAVLIKELEWLGRQVAINGHGYTVMKSGFRSNSSEKDYDCITLSELLHPGIAILYNFVSTGFKANYEGDLPDYYEILTIGRIPHISKRCAECGVQLDQEGIKRGACNACHGEACGH